MKKFFEMYYFGLLPKTVNLADQGFQIVYPQGWVFVFIALALFGYLLGSINFAMVISRVGYREDIRDYGSKNAGTTNMMRTYGKKAAGLTLLGDILKGVVCCWTGILLFGERGGYIAGFFCIVGHIFPIWFRFRGGKGIATTAAVILCMSPWVFLLLFVLFVLLVAITRYISLGSVLCMLFYPFALWSYFMMERNADLFVVCPWRALVALALAALIIYKHKDNIRRLMSGTEHKFSFHGGKKEKK